MSRFISVIISLFGRSVYCGPAAAIMYPTATVPYVEKYHDCATLPANQQMKRAWHYSLFHNFRSKHRCSTTLTARLHVHGSQFIHTADCTCELSYRN